MREDSRVVIFLIYGFAFAIAWNGVLAVWRGADDSNWKVRWERLDDLDQAWLAAASRSRSNRDTLEERGELDLAMGLGRREARQRARIALATLPPFLVGAALLATGPLGDSLALPVFLSFTFLQSLVA
jgi:hypothetical protein